MKRRARTSLIAVAASATLLGCASMFAPDQALSVATERQRYVRAAPNKLAPVMFAVRNTGRETVYVGRCGGLSVYIDRLEAWRWAEHAKVGVVCPAVYATSPLPVTPGEVVTPPAVWLGPGHYRLRVPFGLSPGEQFRQTAISNGFVVE